jgi:hypothetical protein
MNTLERQIGMSKKSRTHKQTATNTLPSRGSRHFLTEVEQGRLTLADLLDMKQQCETNPQFVGALTLEVAQAFGGMPPHSVTQDALRTFHNNVCEAITILSASKVE